MRHTRDLRPQPLMDLQLAGEKGHRDSGNEQGLVQLVLAQATCPHFSGVTKTAKRQSSPGQSEDFLGRDDAAFRRS